MWKMFEEALFVNTWNWITHLWILSCFISIYLSICLSIYLSIYLSKSQSLQEHFKSVLLERVPSRWQSELKMDPSCAVSQWLPMESLEHDFLCSWSEHLPETHHVPGTSWWHLQAKQITLCPCEASILVGDSDRKGINSNQSNIA